MDDIAQTQYTVRIPERDPKTGAELNGNNGNMIERSLSGLDRYVSVPTYQLKIVNGDRDGSNRVTSAKVEINGVPIILAYEVNQDVETLTRTIQLQKKNEIKVTVDGSKKSHMYVTVE